MKKYISERRTMLETIKKRKRNWLGHWLRRDCILRYGWEKERKKKNQLLDNAKEDKSYVEMKMKEQDQDEW